MLSFILTAKFVPGIFQTADPIPTGCRLVQKDEKTFDVFDRQGRHTGTVPAQYVAGMSKRQVADTETEAIIKEIGEAIRRARMTKGMSQEDLAAALKATKQYICKVEAGNGSVSIPQLKKIADALNYKLEVKLTRKYR